MSRWPTGPFELHRTSCYGCVRRSSADGGCGVAGYPCVHYGMDLFADDRSVVAPEAGVVVAVSKGASPPWTGYGPGVVAIRGDSGVYHVLAHLSAIDVSMNQRLREGDAIGAFDRGIAHTHYEVRRNLLGPSKTNTINPDTWVNGISLFTLALLGLGAWGITRWWSGRTAS